MALENAPQPVDGPVTLRRSQPRSVLEWPRRALGWIDGGISAVSNLIQRWLLGWPMRSASALFGYLDSLAPRLEGSWLRAILAVSLFPLLMLATMIIGFWLVENGITARDFFASIIMFAIYGAIFIPLERLMPWSRAWLKGDDDAAADVMIFLSRPLWGMWVAAPIRLATVVVVVDWIGPGIGQSLWPTTLHPWLQVALLIVVSDFFRYWYHRWMHEVPFLWRWHSVHHSSRRLYWFNGTRSHPIEGLVEGMLWAIPLAFVEAPIEIVFVAGLMGRTIGRFQHTNLDVKLGPLDYIFSSPRNHRWHHAPTAKDGDCNYGGDVVVWDHLFGTFHMPKDREPTDRIGIGSVPDYPADWWGMMKAPFLYHRLPKADGYDRKG